MLVLGFLISSILAFLAGHWISSYLSKESFGSIGPYVSAALGVSCFLLAYLVALGGYRNMGIIFIVLFAVPCFISGARGIFSRFSQ